MGLLTSFNAGVSALNVSQAGINTTAHNVSNTRTAGYTRQQNLNTDTYYQFFKVNDKSQMKIGYGSAVAAIRQIRDRFLDKEYRVEVSRLSFYEVLQTTEQEVEDMFGEMEGVEFNNALDSLMNTIQDFSTRPENITDRELFIAKVETFLQKAKDVYTAMRDYQVNLNTQIAGQVDRINAIADQIGALNEKIAYSEASGLENANDYRDARNLLMDELAEYTDYEYVETYNHQVTIRINNAPLVEDTTVHHMVCERMEYYEKDADGNDVRVVSPLYNVRWEDSGFGDVYDITEAYSEARETDRGSLRGILTARGMDFGYYTDIPVDPSQYDLLDYNNTTGACLLQKMEAQFDLLIHKIATSLNDAFCPNVTVDVTDNAELAAKGITGKVQCLFASHCPVGADDDNTIGVEVFARQGSERYTTYILDAPIYLQDETGRVVTDEYGNPYAITEKLDDGKYKVYIYNEEDPEDINSMYSILNLEINQKIRENYSYLPVMGNPASGRTDEYDNSIFANILEAWREEDTVLDPNTLAKYSVDNYYDAMIGALGVQGMIWNGIVDGQTGMVQQTENKRQQASGVSTEEEMVNLLMYQHAYNAASRYITTIDEMLEHIIERLG